MADLDKKPVKGILKNASSFDTDRCEGHQHKSVDKGMKWDEMNILATYHPADKDYGHDKIDEPPTPYSKNEGEGDETRSGDESEGLPIDPQRLVEGLTMKTKAKVFTKIDTVSSGEEDDEEFFSEEEKEKKRVFRMHRKEHYNEFQAVRLARQLLQEEEDDDDDADDVAGSNKAGSTNDQTTSTSSTLTSLIHKQKQKDETDPMEIPDNN